MSKSRLLNKTSFPKRARVWVVLLCGILIVSFVIIPFLTGIFTPDFVDIDASHYANSIEKPAPTSPVIRNAPVAPPILTPQPTATPGGITFVEVSYPTLKFEDKHPSVHRLQSRLMELGYFDYDQTTDTFGSVTESAIILFQRASGLEETGIADSALQELLYSEQAIAYHMAPGDKGTDIKSMQRRLTELGYYNEKDNGFFGTATEQAVRAFQIKNKLEETGVIDQDARDLLFSPKARYKIDPTPTPKPTAKPTPKPAATPKKTSKPAATPYPSYTAIPEFITPELPIDVPGQNGEGEEENEAPITPTNTPKPNSGGNYGSGVTGMLAAANDQLGKPYVLGEEGPDSYDCSGLVYYSLRQAGVNIGRYTAAAYSEYSGWEAITSLSACKAGDLIFYKSDTSTRISHVAIYLGGGRIIHAATSSGRVLISNTTEYYQRNFVIARRVF